jgi:hypothetical protein
LAVSIGDDHAGVDGEGFAAHQPLGHAARHHRLEHSAQKIAIAEAAMAVLGEGRVVGHVAVEAQPTEPAIGQIEMSLVTQPSLGTDAIAVAHQQHPDHQLWSIEGRPTLL